MIEGDDKWQVSPPKLDLCPQRVVLWGIGGVAPDVAKRSGFVRFSDRPDVGGDLVSGAKPLVLDGEFSPHLNIRPIRKKTGGERFSPCKRFGRGENSPTGQGVP